MSAIGSRKRAIFILCVVFFLIPFALRGARNALQQVKNDPNDWLPSSFDETRELKWFARHFIGEKFIVASWDDCNEDDPSFDMFLKKLARECNRPLGVSVGPGRAEATKAADNETLTEAERARLMGDRLGLFLTGEMHTGWGDHDEEKWLQGHGESWYYITKEGKLYEWQGGTGLVEGVVIGTRRMLGDKKARGKLVATLGEPSTSDKLNPYYKNPGLLTGRLFSSVITGPQLLKELTSKEGPLRASIESNLQDDRLVEVAAEAMAYHRLTGSLFGTPTHEGFDWTPESFEKLLTDKQRESLPEDWAEIFAEHVEVYGLETLQNSNGFEREYQWAELFHFLEVEQPARRTCIIANLSELGKGDMARVVGRPILGKPAGIVLRIAEQCGLKTAEPDHDLRLGGPPVDNVAIDEEGTRTLVKLVGYSALVGFILSYLCFRSTLVTLMVFMVGGVSAVISMSIVYYGGQTADAILMSMPAVVYVLGLSGAVHIVNYYRDALPEHGEDLAPWKALKIGWWPCTLAASTTAIGLFSLYFSNIVPIRKFGLFSAIGVLATLVMLFSYLPSALVTWPPGFLRRRESADDESYGRWIESAAHRFWRGVGDFVIRNNGPVAVTCLLVTIGVGYGLTKIDTDVQLLKLFDPNAKIIGDYAWMENNLGKLVPMELVLRVDSDRLMDNKELEDGEARPKLSPQDEALALDLLERLEMTDRVQQVVETQFGPLGSDKMGRGMSAATFFLLPEPVASTGISTAARTRSLMNKRLEASYNDLITTDYLRREVDKGEERELWRISLRLGALNDVDYGRFAHDLKFVVEPVLSAYRYRDAILQGLMEQDDANSFLGKKVVVLGMSEPTDPVKSETKLDSRSKQLQTDVCFSTLANLLIVKGFDGRFAMHWHDPAADNAKESLAEAIQDADCVILGMEHPMYDAAALKNDPAITLVDARDHRFDVDEHGNVTQPTAAQRQRAPEQADETSISVVYTGAVPVIYKAQRTLLVSLMESIGWAFGLIALVMCTLLWSPRAGLVSMLPNVFPVILIFGAMGYIGLKVDIGTMMTASVAMGVAVDDTIHFLMWYRKGIKRGLGRLDSIELAYDHVATAMTQTTLIGGLGLSVFWLSTFTPTQRFGVMMLTLLGAALIGDLIFLPAILAGPLGKWFSRKDTPLRRSAEEAERLQAGDESSSSDSTEPVNEPAVAATPHSSLSPAGRAIRRDRPHST